MGRKCTTVKAHTRDGHKVKQHVRCSKDVSENKIYETEFDKYKSKSEEILENLKQTGINYKYHGYSNSNGNSIYYKVWTTDENNTLKLRFSNHSVSNVNRVLDEVHSRLFIPSKDKGLFSDLEAEIHYRLGNTKNYSYSPTKFIKSQFESTEKRDLKIIGERLSKKGNKIYIYENIEGTAYKYTKK